MPSSGEREAGHGHHREHPVEREKGRARERVVAPPVAVGQAEVGQDATPGLRVPHVGEARVARTDERPGEARREPEHEAIARVDVHGPHGALERAVLEELHAPAGRKERDDRRRVPPVKKPQRRVVYPAPLLPGIAHDILRSTIHPAHGSAAG